MWTGSIWQRDHVWSCGGGWADGGGLGGATRRGNGPHPLLDVLLHQGTYLLMHRLKRLCFITQIPEIMTAHAFLGQILLGQSLVDNCLHSSGW
jgi:hypothetical protein